jgi:hypothetical protein
MGKKDPKRKSFVCQIKTFNYFLLIIMKRQKKKSACHMIRNDKKKMRKMLVT